MSVIFAHFFHSVALLKPPLITNLERLAEVLAFQGWIHPDGEFNLMVHECTIEDDPLNDNKRFSLSW
jgi:hypothetical protein